MIQTGFIWLQCRINEQSRTTKLKLASNP